jgi:hypothetical protein
MYHPDGRPLIPIRKQVDRLITFGKFVAKPIGSLLRRTRSFGNIRLEDPDSPRPPPEKHLRRRATISDLGSEYRNNDNFNPCPSRRHLRANNRASRSARHPERTPEEQTCPHPLNLFSRLCPCEECAGIRELLRGNDPPPRHITWDINKPTGADTYSETWDEWNDRIDFARGFTRLPVEKMDLRRRSRNRNPQQSGQQSAGPTRAPVHHEVATPAHARRPDTSRPPAVPPAPVVPDHVPSHHTNARLLNNEQAYWARQRAEWREARLQKNRESERVQGRQTGWTPVDDWRRGIVGSNSPRNDGPTNRTHTSRLEAPTHSQRRNVPGRRHRSDVPATSRTQNPPNNQVSEGEDSDPFDERALDRAHMTESYRPAPDCHTDVDVKKIFFDALDENMDYLVGWFEPTDAQWDYSRYLSVKVAAKRVYDALNEADRRRDALRYNGPTNDQCTYIDSRLQEHLDNNMPSSSRMPRQPKPTANIGRGRPPVLHTMKALPTLPPPSNEGARPSREPERPSRHNRASYIQTPPPDSRTFDHTQSQRVRRGGEGFTDAQIQARKRELRRELSELKEQEEALAKRDRQRR